MATSEPQPKKKQLSEYDRDVILWRACTSLHMHDGHIIEDIKVLSVLRYVIVIRLPSGDSMLVSKHAVDRAALRQPSQEVKQ